MWRAVTLIMFFLAGLVPIGMLGCASSGDYPPTAHYGVNVGYGRYWRDDHRHDHYHHYRPRPRPPHRPDRPNRPNRPNRPRPRPARR